MAGTYLTILYESDAKDWNAHITECFSVILKKLFPCDEWKIHSLQLKDIELPLTSSRIGVVTRSRLQVIILSPMLLKYIAKNPNVFFGQLFNPHKVICLLCGVKNEDVTLHRASLGTYDSWRKIIIVDHDSDFSNKLFVQIKQLMKNNIGLTGNAGFKLNPCKVLEGSSKVLIELESPITNSNNVSVYLVADNIEQSVVFKQSNPYTLKISIPDIFFAYSQFVFILVKINGESLGQKPLKCESKMSELNQLLKSVLDPLEFICQTLGLSSSRNVREKLDKYLVECFVKNVATCGLSAIDIGAVDYLPPKSEEKLPTLLHWCAQNGLQELATQLLNCPRAAEACNQKNQDGLTAADIAEANGFSCLANMLENFTKLKETTEIYMYMKNLTENIDSVVYENIGARCGSSYNMGGQNTIPSRNPLNATENDFSRLLSFSKEDMINGVNAEVSADTEDEVSLRNKHKYSNCQQELIQLLEDFKREKYTISEVELLCKSLELNHRSASFNEKREQLNLLRQEYEKAQKDRLQEGKSSSLLERCRVFFKKSSKKESQVNCTAVRGTASYVKPAIYIDGAAAPRPVCRSNTFSFSTSKPKSRPHSSCSSGSSRCSSLSDRSSTFSGSSCGSVSDSSVLWNIEEEKLLNKSKAQNINSELMIPNSNVAHNLEYLHVSPGSRPTSDPQQCRRSAQHSELTTTLSAPEARTKPHHIKPLPPPKPNGQSKQGKQHTVFSHDSVCLSDDDCPMEPPPLPPGFQTGSESARGIYSNEDDYLAMGSKSLPTMQHIFGNSEIVEECDYYNLPLRRNVDESSEDYLEMTLRNTYVNVTNGVKNRTQRNNPIYENVNPMLDKQCDGVPEDTRNRNLPP